MRRFFNVLGGRSFEVESYIRFSCAHLYVPNSSLYCGCHDSIATLSYPLSHSFCFLEDPFVTSWWLFFVHTWQLFFLGIQWSMQQIHVTLPAASRHLSSLLGVINFVTMEELWWWKCPWLLQFRHVTRRDTSWSRCIQQQIYNWW